MRCRDERAQVRGRDSQSHRGRAVSRAAILLRPILARRLALPARLVSMFAVEIAAVLLLAVCWLICALLFSLEL